MDSQLPNEIKISVEEMWDDKKLEAVRLYLRTGSLAAVSRELDIPVYDLQQLARTQWWMQEVRALRIIEHAVLDAQFTDILGQTLAELKQRIEFGEDYTDKEGNLRHRSLSASSLCRIAETVFDKRQLIRGLPTSVTNEGGKLQELAEKLEALGKSQAARTIEMEPSQGGGAKDGPFKDDPTNGVIDLN